MRFICILSILAAYMAGLGAAAARQSVGELIGQANAAYEAGDFAGFRDRIEELVLLRPYSAPIRGALARAHVLTGNSERAMEILEAIAAEGLIANAAAEGDLAPLAAHPRHAALMARLAANAEPAGVSEIAAELPEIGLLPEGVALDPASGAMFLSSVRLGRLFRIERDGAFREIAATTEDNAIGGLYALAFDAEEGLIWAASNTAAPYGGPKEGKPESALIAIAADSGEILRVLPSPEPGGLIGEVKLGPDGRLYATDSILNKIYAAAPDAEALTEIPLLGERANLQGLALSADGAAAYVADYHLGILRVDLGSGSAAPLPHPPGLNPSGGDGLYRRGRDLIVIQNGLRPYRIMRLRLSEDGGEIIEAERLAASLPEWDEPTLGALGADGFYYSATSQWPAYDNEGNARAGVELRNALIMRLRLD